VSMFGHLLARYLDYIYQDTVQRRYAAQRACMEHNPAARLLDIGCQAGVNTLLLAQAAGTRHIVGLDYNARTLREAAQKGICALVGDANRPLPFADASFDAVTMTDVLEHLVDPRLAISEARRSLARNPSDPVLNYLLAEALLRKGAGPGDAAFEEARQSLRRSIEAAPQFAKARTALAKTELALGRPGEAISHLEVAVKADPTDQIALSTLVTALQRAGRPEQARALAVRLRTLIAEERDADLRRTRGQPVH